MKNKLLILIALLIVIGGFVWVNKAATQTINTNGKMQVTASFYPLYFFATQIAGDKADVKNITPSGSEPHDYEPTSRDIARIETGQLLILNGNVETWGNKIQENLKGKNVTIVIAGEGLLTRDLVEEGTKTKDPHIWLDPQLAKKEVAKIVEGFIKIDPANTYTYHKNQIALNNKLNQLDNAYKTGLASCQRKDIITSHAAFGYLATQYGLNQVAVSGISPDEEPSSQQLANVAKFAKDNQVKYIFFESLISPKLSETIASEVGAETLVLDPLEGISDDDIKQGKNYFTVMEENLNNLQKALECKK